MSVTDQDTRIRSRGSQPQPARAQRPPPDPHGWESIEELLIGHRAATHQLLDKHEQLVRLLEKIDKPARVEPIVLTQSNPIAESGALKEPTRSIGLYNPSGSLGTVRLGVMGSASVADAFPVPPGKLIVLPITAGIVEIGTNAPLLATDSLYCFLLRYSSVQEAYLGGDQGEPGSREFSVPQPAVGAELAFSIPAGQWWKLQSLQFFLTTSGAAGSRYGRVEILDPSGNVAWMGGPSGAQNLGAGTSRNYQYNRLGPVVAGSNGPTGVPDECFLPDLWIPPGFVVTTSSGLQAGDQYTALRGFAQISTEQPAA